MRFKGVDPERFFNFIYPYIRWFFTVPAMVCCITLALAALSLILVQFDVFHSRLPDFHTFFQAQNWLWLALEGEGLRPDPVHQWRPASSATSARPTDAAAKMGLVGLSNVLAIEGAKSGITRTWSPRSPGPASPRSSSAL